MKYRDLRDFVAKLETIGELKRISQEVSPKLEITEICSRVLNIQGPALLFTKPSNYKIPMLANLFGTKRRVALGMGANDVNELRKIGQLLSELKEPTPPKKLSDILEYKGLASAVWDMTPKKISSPPCQEIILSGNDVNLYDLPIQHCWTDDAAPLITWGLTITKGPHKERQNIGIYRQQLIARNKLIMRWLTHRGGAQDFREHTIINRGKPFPVCVALGADPATLLAAVTPIPDNLSEYQFSGLLRNSRSEIAQAIGNGLWIPAFAEIVLEGSIQPDEKHPSDYEHALEGPFGDHTGYYNEQEYFPVFTVERITMRKNPIYLSTYTGKPPDEPSILGESLNEVFIPILQKQFPEITDFYLPPEGCSYRMAVLQMKKLYAGHAKRLMMGVWSFLRQFMYTKFIVVVDEDINARDWKEVIWAITTRVDPKRDTVFVENTPIDYLDFASPVSGLGSKMGIDATNKWSEETNRNWGKPIYMSEEVKNRIDTIWKDLNL